jgi:hypothetical protein
MFVGALFLAAPAAAQGPAAQSAPAPATTVEPTRSTMTVAQIDRLRADVGTFEIALRRAIDKAALEMSQWAEQIVPDFMLGQAAEPVVHGVPAGDVSITFNVEVSSMVGVSLFQSLAQQRLRSQPPAAGSNPVQRVGATGAQVVQGDPVTGPVASPKTAAVTSDDFNQHYSDLVRGAVIDTVLDQSGVLTLKDDQVLVVAVIPATGQSRQLILTIKGGDLNQLRQAKISRDEAKRRIIETRF